MSDESSVTRRRGPGRSISGSRGWRRGAPPSFGRSYRRRKREVVRGLGFGGRASGRISPAVRIKSTVSLTGVGDRQIGPTQMSDESSVTRRRGPGRSISGSRGWRRGAPPSDYPSYTACAPGDAPADDPRWLVGSDPVCGSPHSCSPDLPMLLTRAGNTESSSSQASASASPRTTRAPRPAPRRARSPHRPPHAPPRPLAPPPTARPAVPARPAAHRMPRQAHPAPARVLVRIPRCRRGGIARIN